MNRRTLFIFISFILIPILAVLFLEFALYLAGTETTYESRDPFLGFESVVSLFEKVQQDGEEVYRTRSSKLEWFNLQEFQARKPVNGYRVFCFGGSTTFGRPYIYKTSYSNWFQVLLQDLMPRKKVEVINVGGVSYASYRIVNLMQEMSGYDPDLFIVYSGHNEFLENRTYQDILETPESVMKLRQALNNLRTYSLIREKWLALKNKDMDSAKQKFEMSREVAPILDQSMGLDRYNRELFQHKAVLDHFETNMQRMIGIAQQNDIDILFIVPPSNEKDFSPFKSQLSELTPQDKNKWIMHYERGRFDLDDENINSAMESFAKAISIDSAYADLRFRNGTCLFTTGDYHAAKREFTAAIDLDVAPLRATSEIQGVVRQTCGEQDVACIDLVKILENQCARNYNHTILGKEYFLDHAHPTIAVHQLIAEKLAAESIKRKIIEPEKDWQNVPRQALYDSVMSTVDTIYYAMRDLNLAKVLDWAGKHAEAVPFILKAAEQLPDHPEAQYMRGLVYVEKKKYDLAQRDFQRAIALDSTYAKAYNALGSVYEKTDRLDRALRMFKEAIRLQPDSDQAYYNLGNTIYQQGKIKQAEQAYLQALEFNPNYSKAMNNLGVIYLTTGRLDRAEEAFHRTLDMNPANHNAIANLGIIYFQKGQKERARQMFRQALTIDPGDAFSAGWLKRLGSE
ncbi:tetratricopeptide repeat protein [candidate division KSB1 bacterium]|nr:tetratricopeptide repeat protein [candidate division KSB1 bacterium]